MRSEEGNPKLETTQNLPDFPYARFADSIGLKGIQVDRPEDVGQARGEALAADRPVVFEAYISGNVPTLPPHISFEQAKELTSALVKGDPEEVGIIKHSVKELLCTSYTPFEVRQSSAITSIFTYPTYIKTSDNDEVDGHSHHAGSSSENNNHTHDDKQKRSILAPLRLRQGWK
jgi:hypothetical protein